MNISTTFGFIWQQHIRRLRGALHHRELTKILELFNKVNRWNFWWASWGEMGQPFVSMEHPHPQRHNDVFFCFQTYNSWNNNNPITIDSQALFLIKTLAIYRKVNNLKQNYVCFLHPSNFVMKVPMITI
jgi:hypothetical protein